MLKSYIYNINFYSEEEKVEFMFMFEDVFEGEGVY